MTEQTKMKPAPAKPPRPVRRMTPAKALQIVMSAAEGYAPLYLWNTSDFRQAMRRCRELKRILKLK